MLVAEEGPWVLTMRMFFTELSSPLNNCTPYIRSLYMELLVLVEEPPAC